MRGLAPTYVINGNVNVYHVPSASNVPSPSSAPADSEHHPEPGEPVEPSPAEAQP
jgi:hypothetical protein